MATGTGVGFGFDTSFLKNLELADKKIHDLMNGSNQMAKSVMSAFQQITSQGVVPYVKSLEQQLKVLESVKASITDSAGHAKRGFGAMKTDVMNATNAITQLVTTLKGTSEYQTQKAFHLDENVISRYKELKRTIENLEKVKKDAQNTKATSTNQEEVKNAQQTLRAVNKLLRDAKAEAKNIEVNSQAEAERAKTQLALAGARERNKIAERSPEGALNYARSLDTNIKSLNTMRTAVSRLKSAQANLNLNTSEGKKKYRELQKEIDKLEKQLGKTTKSHNTFARSLRQFAGTLVSIRTLHNYFTKLVDIRGEFEKQHKSLQVLIGDLDMANDIWGKTVALAVKSPFSVKELVTYTKQLAAYRVEADKLYETNKMLADISAGLGVDMNRLILAFGQVKAANYLRGTELRQFSEAGINILGELATYFTELEGRAVSVGDVFERVSKRMVSFEDVNAVLQRVTDEGGIFYQMQEKQAQTLIGMRTNLKDTVDLMFNEIGKSYEDTLKNVLKLTKAFIDGWRTALPIITAVGTAFLFYFSVANFSRITRAITGLMGAFSPLGLTVGLIAGVAAGLAAWYFQANKVKSAMAEVEKSVTQSLEESISLYKKLTDTIKDVTATHKERNNALKELKRNFEEILPDEYLEVSYIKEKPNAYREATDAMLAYYNAKALKQKEDKIRQIHDTTLTDTDIPELTSAYKEAIQNMTGKEIDYATSSVMIDNVKRIITQVVKDIKAGKVGVNKLEEEINKRLLEFVHLDGAEINFDGVRHQIKDLEKELTSLFIDLDDITGMPYRTYAQEIAGGIINEEKKNIAQVEQIFKGLINSYSNYAELSEDAQKQLDEDSEKILESLPDNLINYKTYLENVFKEIKISAAKGVYEFGAEMQGLERKFYKGGWTTDYLSNKSLAKIAASNVTQNYKYRDFFLRHTNEKDIQDMFLNFQEELDKEGEKLDYTNFQTAVTDGIKNIVTESKNAIDDFVDYIPKIGESLSDVRTEVEGDLANMRDQVKQYENSIAQGQDTENALAMTAEEYERLKAIIPTLQRIYEFLGGDPEKQKNDKSNKESINAQISLIKEMREAYVDLNEVFDETTSKEKVMTSYAEAFRRTFEGVGLSLQGKILDSSKIEELKKVGEISDEVAEKLNELQESGTHIRSYSDDALTDIKYWESFKANAYNIGDGRWTIGYGETQGVKQGDTITQEEADAKLRKRLTEDFVVSLNKVLDANKDIIVTQEQYNALLSLTYQGGEGAVSRLFQYAKDEEKAVEHIQSIHQRVKEVFGEQEAERFGEAFVNKFKESESIYERIAMLLQTMNITINGGKIDKSLYQGMQKRSDARAEIFSYGKELNDIFEKAVVDFSDLDITDVQGVVAFLEKLRPYAQQKGKEAMDALEKAIASYNTQIGIEFKVKQDKNLLREFESLFSDYEVSLELDQLNIPKDLQKQLFNVDNITLPELRAKLEDSFSKFSGTDMEEDEYIKLLDKLSKLEDEQLEERAKKYSKYLIKAQGERVKIKMEELRAIEELETLHLTKPQKTLATQAIQKESQQKLDKLEWEDFKDSGMYVQLFESMDVVSTRALTNMRNRLMELSTQLKDLDADDLRNLFNQIEKIDKELATRNPFKTLITGIREYSQARREQKTLEATLATQDSQIASAEKAERNTEMALAKKKREYEKAQKDGKSSQETLNALKQQIEGTEQMLSTQRSTSAELRKQRKETQKNLDNGKKTQEYYKAAALEAGAYITEAGNALPQIAGNIENVFGAMDAKTKDMVDTTAGILTSAGGIVSGFASGNYIQAIASVFQLIGEIAQIGDKKKERQIQKEIELVEKLGKQYEKLEKAVNEAYAVDLLKENFDLANKNIDEQIDSYEEMMRLEDDKKKTDKKRIEEWKEEIEALREQQEELLHSQVEELGGTYDYRSATRDFVDAWVDAFKETGDGLSGLKNNFKDFYANIVAEQAVMQGASNIMKPLLDEINKSLENDFEVTEGEWDKIKNLSDKQFANLDEFLKGFYSKFSELTSEEGELSGLQRGIQGITEQQADILAAYLNSIRFFVSDSNSQLKELVALQGGGNQEVNPMLSELRAHTELITSIRDMFSSVIGRGDSRHAGAYLKVLV